MFKKKKPVKRLSSKAVEIKSKNEPEKPEKAQSSTIKNIVGIVAFLALIIIIFFVVKNSLVPSQNYETYSYNGFEFTSNGVLWHTQIYDETSKTLYNIQLHNGPREVEDVPVEGDVHDIRKRATGFYITFDPLENETMGHVTLAAYEISSNYATVYGRNIFAACDKNVTEECADRPIVDCTDPTKPAIYLIAEGEAKVYVDSPCIYVQGEGDELIRAANRLLYQWYGIMK
jgi:hypothetical protein